MSENFKYDVFLSHSTKDNTTVRAIAERLRTDGLHVWFDECEIKPGDSIPAKIEEGLEYSRVLVLCMSANAFGSDWAQLEARTFRFRDPLNKERRLIPLRFDETPIKGSLAQFLYINWRAVDGEQEYPKLFEACQPRKPGITAEQRQASDRFLEKTASLGRLLALEVAARITSADQKCFEIPATEDEGIDMELEFTDDKGKGTGKRLYLQLKSGNGHLKKLKNGEEVFRIKEPRWVDYWLKQPSPVMLVIGTFAEEDERSAGKEKLEFADVRWMEISSYLKRESQDGTKPVTQIVFKGERLDMTSLHKWREKIVNGTG